MPLLQKRETWGAELVALMDSLTTAPMSGKYEVTNEERKVHAALLDDDQVWQRLLVFNRNAKRGVKKHLKGDSAFEDADLGEGAAPSSSSRGRCHRQCVGRL